MTTKIWYQDPAGAFGRDALKFVPLGAMTLTEKLNAVFRLVVYYSVVMTLVTQRGAHLGGALLFALLTAAIHVIWAGRAAARHTAA